MSLTSAPRFQSHEEFFAFVEHLLERLERTGHADAVIELREGLSTLNGLTDGWASFLETIDRVQLTSAKSFATDQQRDLRTIRAGVVRLVSRR